MTRMTFASGPDASPQPGQAPGPAASGAEGRSFAPQNGPREAVFPIAAETGAGLIVRVVLQPLVRLADRRAVGVRATRRVLGAGVEVPLRALEPAEAARVDAEAYGQGLALLVQAEPAAALIPIELTTLMRTEGRIAYLDACLKAPRLGPAGACAEIQGVGAEVTPQQLDEAAVLLGRAASSVIVHVGRDGAAIEGLQGERAVGGVCLDVRDAGAVAWPGVAALVRKARAHTGLVLLEGLEPALLPYAVAAGATHAVLAPAAISA